MYNLNFDQLSLLFIFIVPMQITSPGALLYILRF